MRHNTEKSTPVPQAERFFQRGLEALTVGNHTEAVHLFETAISVERSKGAVRRQMRYLSYYGLSLSTAYGASAESVRLCEEAAEQDVFDTDLQLNLIRVYLMAGRKTKALALLEKGLRQYPGHQRYLALLNKLDRRAKPSIPFLHRDHWINRLLGRWLNPSSASEPVGPASRPRKQKSQGRAKSAD